MAAVNNPVGGGSFHGILKASEGYRNWLTRRERLWWVMLEDSPDGIFCEDIGRHKRLTGFSISGYMCYKEA